MSGTPGFDLLSPQELAGILGDLKLGESFVEKMFVPTPCPRANGIIKKATSTRFGLPQESAKWTPGQTVKTGPGTTFADVSFRAQDYAWQEGTPWEEAKRVSDYIPLYAYNAQVARDVCVTERDVDAATAIAGASWAYTNTPLAADRWNATTSYPNKQLLAAKQGFRPGRANAVLMSQDAFASYRVNPNVLSGMNVSADHAMADEDWFMRAVGAQLGFQIVAVVDSMYNTAQTQASQTLAEVFAGKVWVGQLAFSPGVSNSEGSIDGMQASALVRVQTAPLTLNEFDENKQRMRYAQAHLAETLVVADTRLGGLISAVNG